MIYMENSPSNLFASNNYINAISLPQSSDASINFARSAAIISGFGRVNNLMDSSILRWAETSIISNTECRLYFGGLIKEGNICVSTVNGRSPCSGDSGKK